MTTVTESEWTPRAVAASLGISVTTLRTWDARHGLGPTRRSPGGHRRYTDEDVRRLRRMMDLTAGGMSAAAAAALAQQGDADVDDRPPAAARMAGRAAVRGLLAAASRLDTPGLNEIACRAVTELGVVEAWQRLFLPVLSEIGDGVARGTLGVAAEHVTSAAITHALNSVPVPRTSGRVQALLAAAPEEQHALPLHALGAALAELGYGHRNLGGRVPPDSLLDAVRRVRPRAVFLWAHTEVVAGLVPIGALLRERVPVVAAGPGWSPSLTPAPVRLVASLEEAVAALLDADHGSGT